VAMDVRRRGLSLAHRYEVHAADGAVAGAVGDHGGMHGAVIDRGGSCAGAEPAQRHRGCPCGGEKDEGEQSPPDGRGDPRARRRRLLALGKLVEKVGIADLHHDSPPASRRSSPARESKWTRETNAAARAASICSRRASTSRSRSTTEKREPRPAVKATAAARALCSARGRISSA